MGQLEDSKDTANQQPNSDGVNEAEIQLLASLEKASLEGGSTDRESLEAQADRYWIFRQDWSDAYSGLVAKGLAACEGGMYRLTDAGRPLARQYHRQRPDMYWYYYQKFYQAARTSAAHSELCRRVFGEDLCQEGQADMAALDDLIGKVDPQPGARVLDLGCGAGGIAEYIADRTGALVTGLDYSEPAIDEANRRTAGKSSRLTFLQGDMNSLELESNSLDVVVSLDTLYWVSDLENTLSKVIGAMRPGGRMGIFMNHHLEEGQDLEGLEPENSKLASALTNLRANFETTDYTRQIGEFWQRNWQAAIDLQEKFEVEGNGFIAASLIRESEDDYLPDIRAGRIARYLYSVQI